MRTASLVAAAGVLVAVQGLSGQPRPSQHGAVSQTVNETLIELAYDRPVARGRELFGDLVPWDAVWTPGANRATWVEFSTPVTIGEHALPAGRYGVWTVPHQGEPWEVVLVSQWDAQHLRFPARTEVARIRVAPETGEHMETLAWYFPVVGPYETTLRMHWGRTILPLTIRVGPEGSPGP